MATTALSYMKNVAKSFGYAFQDNFNEMNPTVAALFRETKDLKDDLYQSIDNFKAKIANPDSSIRSEINDTTKELWANLSSDLRTGKWYNKARKEKAQDAAMSAMFGGIDFDDFGDFDADFDDADSDLDEQASIQEDSTKAMAQAMDVVGGKTAAAISAATVNSANYIVQSGRMNTRALYTNMSSGFNQVSTGLAAVNSNISTIVKLGEPLTKHMQNSAVFYSRSNEYQEKALKLLEKIAENTSPKTGTKNKTNERLTMNDMFTSEGMISVDSLKQYAKQAVEDSPIGMLKSMLGLFGGIDGVKGMVTGAPLTMLLPLLTGQIFNVKGSKGISMRDTMKNFNKALSGMFAGGVARLQDAKFGAGFLGDIGRALQLALPKSGVKNKFDPKNYEKGPVDWDGKSRMALMNVIPTQLAQILAAITGKEEMRFDYNNGKWIKVSTIREMRQKRMNSAGNEAGGEILQALKNSITNSNMSDTTKAGYNKELTAFFAKLVQNDNTDFLHILDEDFNLEAYKDAISPAVFKDMQRRLRAIRRARPHDYSQLARNTYSARARFGRQSMDEDSMEVQLDNGSIGGAGASGVKQKKPRIRSERQRYTEWRRAYRGLAQTIDFDTWRHNPLFQMSISPYADQPLMVGSPLNMPSAPIMDAGRSVMDQVDQYGKNNLFYLHGIYQYTGYLAKNLKYLVPGREADKGNRIILEAPPVVQLSNNTVEAIGRAQVNLQQSESDTQADRDRMAADIEANAQEELNLKSTISRNINKLSSVDRDFYLKAQDDPDLQNSDRYKRLVEKLANYDSLSSHINSTTNTISNKVKNSVSKFKFVQNAQETLGITSDEFSNIFDAVTETINGMVYGKDENGVSIMDSVKTGVKDIFNTLTLHIADYIPGPVKDFFNSLWNSGPIKNFRQQTKESLKSLFGWFIGGNDNNREEQSRAAREWQDSMDWNGPGYNSGESGYGSGLIKYINRENKISRDIRHNQKYFGVGGGASAAPQPAPNANADVRVNTRERHTNAPSQDEDSEEDADPDPASKQEMARRTINKAATKVANKIIDGLTNLVGKEKPEEERKKIKSNIEGLMKDVAGAKGAMGAGALVGAGTSLITGAFLGPIAGAAIGASVGFLTKSKTAQNVLFGEEVEDEDGNKSRTGGVLGKEATDFIYKHAPSMAKGAGIGMAGGLFLGSPVLGAILGSTVGYVSSSDKAKAMLFGKMGKDGYEEGLFKKEFQEKVKKAFPRMAAGAVAGMVAGPFGGIVANAILGSTLGFATTTNSFKEWFFGKDKDGKLNKLGKGGFSGLVVTKLFNPVIDLFKNLTSLIKQTITETVTGIGKHIRDFILKRIGRRLTRPLNKVGNFVKGGLGKAANAAFSGITAPVRGISNFTRNRDLARGADAYLNGKLMTVEDRVNYRKAHPSLRRGVLGQNVQEQFDKDILYGMKDDKEGLQELRDTMAQVQDWKGAYNKRFSDARSKSQELFQNAINGAGGDRNIENQIFRIRNKYLRKGDNISQKDADKAFEALKEMHDNGQIDLDTYKNLRNAASEQLQISKDFDSDQQNNGEKMRSMLMDQMHNSQHKIVSRTADYIRAHRDDVFNDKQLNRMINATDKELGRIKDKETTVSVDDQIKSNTDEMVEEAKKHTNILVGIGNLLRVIPNALGFDTSGVEETGSNMLDTIKGGFVKTGKAIQGVNDKIIDVGDTVGVNAVKGAATGIKYGVKGTGLGVKYTVKGTVAAIKTSTAVLKTALDTIADIYTGAEDVDSLKEKARQNREEAQAAKEQFKQEKEERQSIRITDELNERWNQGKAREEREASESGQTGETGNGSGLYRKLRRYGIGASGLLDDDQSEDERSEDVDTDSAGEDSTVRDQFGNIQDNNASTGVREKKKERKGFFSAISNVPVIGAGVSKLVGIANAIYEKLVGDGTPKKESLFTKLFKLIGTVGGGLLTLFGGGSILGKFTNILGGPFKFIFDKVKDIGGKFFSWIGDKISNLPIVTAIKEAIKSAASKAFDTIADKLGGSALIEAIKDGIKGALVQFLPTLASGFGIGALFGGSAKAAQELTRSDEKKQGYNGVLTETSNTLMNSVITPFMGGQYLNDEKYPGISKGIKDLTDELENSDVSYSDAVDAYVKKFKEYGVKPEELATDVGAALNTGSPSYETQEFARRLMYRYNGEDPDKEDEGAYIDNWDDLTMTYGASGSGLPLYGMGAGYSKTKTKKKRSSIHNLIDKKINDLNLSPYTSDTGEFNKSNNIDTFDVYNTNADIESYYNRINRKMRDTVGMHELSKYVISSFNKQVDYMQRATLRGDVESVLRADIGIDNSTGKGLVKPLFGTMFDLTKTAYTMLATFTGILTPMNAAIAGVQSGLEYITGVKSNTFDQRAQQTRDTKANEFGSKAKSVFGKISRSLKSFFNSSTSSSATSGGTTTTGVTKTTTTTSSTGTTDTGGSGSGLVPLYGMGGGRTVKDTKGKETEYSPSDPLAGYNLDYAGNDADHSFIDQIWSYLKSLGLNDGAAAGILGNVRAESGGDYAPYRVQYRFSDTIKAEMPDLKKKYEDWGVDFTNYHTVDKTLTQNVDNGNISMGWFMKPRGEGTQDGYGISQFTFAPYKEQLYRYAKKKHTSVGNLAAQLDVLMEQLKDSGVYEPASKKDATAYQVAKDMLLKYEKPDNASSMVDLRTGYAEEIYKKYKGTNPNTLPVYGRAGKAGGNYAGLTDDPNSDTLGGPDGESSGDSSGDFSSTSGTTTGGTTTNEINRQSTIIDQIISVFSNAFTRMFGGEAPTNTTTTVGTGGTSSSSDSDSSEAGDASPDNPFKGKSNQPYQIMQGWKGKLVYSQAARDPHYGSADCSSAVQAAILDADGPDIGGWTNPQSLNTHNMDIVKRDTGGITSGEITLVPNDVLLYQSTYSMGNEGKYPFGIGHAAMYVGDGKMIEQTSRGDGSKGTYEGNMRYDRLVQVSRVKPSKVKGAKVDDDEDEEENTSSSKAKDTLKDNDNKKNNNKKNNKKDEGGSGSGLGAGASGFVSQLDSKYKGLSVGGRSMQDNGCGPASAVMALGSMGKGTSVGSAAALANHYQTKGGTDAAYFKDIFNRNGVSSSYVTGNSVKRAVASGNPVVLMGQDKTNTSKRRSPFGPRNHYVVAKGVDSNGNVNIADPESNSVHKYSSSILDKVKVGVAAKGTGGLSGPLGFGGGKSKKSSDSSSDSKKTSTDDTENTTAVSTKDNGDTKKVIWDFLRSKVGLTEAGTAGVMGCWEQESSNKPNTVEGFYIQGYPGDDKVFSNPPQSLDNYVKSFLFPAYARSGYNINHSAYVMDGKYAGYSAPGLGLAQWTGPRTSHLLEYAKNHGDDWRTLKGQLDFFVNGPGEFKSNSSYNYLKSANNVYDAVANFYQNFESGGKAISSDDKRLSSGQSIYNKYKGTGVTTDLSSFKDGDYASGDSSSSGDSTGSTGTEGGTAQTDTSQMTTLQKIITIFNDVFNAVLSGREYTGSDFSTGVVGKASTVGGFDMSNVDGIGANDGTLSGAMIDYAASINKQMLDDQENLPDDKKWRYGTRAAKTFEEARASGIHQCQCDTGCTWVCRPFGLITNKESFNDGSAEGLPNVWYRLKEDGHDVSIHPHQSVASLRKAGKLKAPTVFRVWHHAFMYLGDYNGYSYWWDTGHKSQGMRPGAKFGDVHKDGWLYKVKEGGYINGGLNVVAYCNFSPSLAKNVTVGSAINEAAEKPKGGTTKVGEETENTGTKDTLKSGSKKNNDSKKNNKNSGSKKNDKGGSGSGLYDYASDKVTYINDYINKKSAASRNNGGGASGIINRNLRYKPSKAGNRVLRDTSNRYSVYHSGGSGSGLDNETKSLIRSITHDRPTVQFKRTSNTPVSFNTRDTSDYYDSNASTIVSKNNNVQNPSVKYGMSKDTAAMLKVIIALVEKLVSNTDKVDNIYSILETYCKNTGNSELSNAVTDLSGGASGVRKKNSKFIPRNTNTQATIDSLADLKEICDMILIG